MQGNLFPSESSWRMPTEFPEIDEPVAIDCETKDPYLKTKAPGFVPGGIGYIIGISVATRTWKAYYPVRHEGGGNLEMSQVFGWLRRQMAKPNPKVFANASYDLGWLATEKVVVNGPIHDVQIMAPLINENRFQYSLDSLAKDYLGEGKDEKLLKQAARDFGLKDIKGNMWRLPPKYVGHYAEADADRTIRLFYLFRDEIKLQDLEQVYALEQKVQPVVLKMRQRGIRIDVEKAEFWSQEFRKREKEAQQKINKMVNLHVDVWSSDSLGKVFDQEGIPYPRTPKGKPSITADYLEVIEHPVGELIRNAKKYQKAYSTFIDSYLLERHINGRLFAQFNQLRSDDGGTVSGRFSSCDPNLQNIPSKDPELGPLLRSLFLPEEGHQWMAADYSNQEPRLMVHFAALCKMEGTEQALAKYKENPKISYHKIVQELIEKYVPAGLDPYKVAKTINLGRAYGMGGPKLCRSLGLPTKMALHWKTGEEIEVAGDVGQQILDNYIKAVPFADQISQLCQKRARSRKFITTIYGRRCRFPNGFEHKALNRLIQGSAADQTKKAMIDMDANNHTILVTVHDELGMSVKDNKEIKEVKEIMENAVQLKVPSVCDIDIGKSWGDARPFVLD